MIDFWSIIRFIELIAQTYPQATRKVQKQFQRCHFAVSSFNYVHVSNTILILLLLINSFPSEHLLVQS